MIYHKGLDNFLATLIFGTNLGEGLKKQKKIMENSILGGEGVSEGHFPYPIF